MVYYREVQPFYRNPVIWFAVAVVVLVIGRTLMEPGIRESGPISAVVVAPLVLLFWILSVRLETEVRADGVHLRFRALWFPKTIPWRQIESAEAVEYRPILHYGGWGIRCGWKGWAWNVSGSRGVKLRHPGGKTFLIGSAQPDGLARAIDERLAASQPARPPA